MSPNCITVENIPVTHQTDAKLEIYSNDDHILGTSCLQTDKILAVILKAETRASSVALCQGTDLCYVI